MLSAPLAGHGRDTRTQKNICIYTWVQNVFLEAVPPESAQLPRIANAVSETLSDGYKELSATMATQCPPSAHPVAATVDSTVDAYKNGRSVRII